VGMQGVYDRKKANRAEYPQQKKSDDLGLLNKFVAFDPICSRSFFSPIGEYCPRFRRGFPCL